MTHAADSDAAGSSRRRRQGIVPCRNVTADGRVVGPSRTTYPASSPLEDVAALFPSFRTSWSAVWADPASASAVSVLGAAALSAAVLIGYRRWWRRLRNADSLTSAMIARKPWVRGVVTRLLETVTICQAELIVDNFRLYHTPGPFFRLPFRLRRIPTTIKELKDETLHIRIAGVDAPENAHFGNPAQPHAKESLDWLRALLLGKRMRCQLLRKDQYNRVVAVPYISRTLLLDKPLPPLMLREGMAVVYTAGGSEYGPWGLDKLKRYEDEARRKKRGLWALKTFEHPADYKRRMKIGEGEVDDGVAKVAKPSGLFGWIRRLKIW